MSAILGWDIGGAHVKAARVEDGVVVAAAQIPCAPHQGLGELEAALRAMRDRMGEVERHAVTMTAELSDAFADRQRGVVSIAAIFAHEIAPDALFYAGARGFVEKQHVAAAAAAIASANWRAPAEVLAQRIESALLIDMGSTTTDLILVREGVVAAKGDDDASRLATGELVYTGLLRGDPAMGVSLAPIDGRWTGLVGERFATMADVRRLTGDLTAETDTLPTADGRSKKSRRHARAACAARRPRRRERNAAAMGRARAIFRARADAKDRGRHRAHRLARASGAHGAHCRRGDWPRRHRRLRAARRTRLSRVRRVPSGYVRDSLSGRRLRPRLRRGAAREMRSSAGFRAEDLLLLETHA